MISETDKRLREIYEAFGNPARPVRTPYIKSIHALVNLAEAKDPHTKKHSVKVVNYAALIAKCMHLSAREIEIVKLAGMLHDIGKIAIREEVLSKNGSLNGKEYEEVKKHSEIGVEIIKPLKFLSHILTSIKHHHENYDGTGYPDGLKGKSIPLVSRILAVADTYDALTSKRAYREAYTVKKAIEIMRAESDKRFDPKILEIFIRCHSLKEKSAL